MTPQEALDRIAALCDEGDRDDFQGITIKRLRAVLAAVSPETGGVLDRDQAHDVLTDVYRLGTTDPRTDAALDRLAGCVRPAAVDRDALWREVGITLNLLIASGAHYPEDVARATDAILALVRPVAGVTLTPGEAALAEAAVRFMAPSVGGAGRERLRALAARLESS